ncbi:MAG: sodium:calcium antiporter [Chloroflexota bacterium]
MLPPLFIVGAILIIFVGCELFVNSVEWLGRALNISERAVGTVLAAIGTALPESLVTLFAVAFGSGAASRDIGIGAIIGGPLLLSTLAYFFVGLAALTTRKKRVLGSRLEFDQRGISRDVRWFLGIFALAIGISLAPWHAAKLLVALLIVAVYFAYVASELGEEAGERRRLAPLYLHRRAESPDTWRVGLQVLVGVVAMGYGAHLFVANLSDLAGGVGLPVIVLSMLLSPLATELPEVMNAVLWVRQGKEDLAIGNVSGSMLVQAAIPCALGLVFTPWNLSVQALAGVAAIFASTLLVYANLRAGRLSARLLLLSGLPYVVLVALLLGGL